MKREPIKVLSLFDGISCARVALDRLGFPVSVYHASEIDKYAGWISAQNYPAIIRHGYVQGIKGEDIGRVDLLIGGSPCQDLSIAKRDRAGLKGSRSGLFYEYVRILLEVQPKYFVLENVASMPKDAQEEISKTLGVRPIMIDAELVSGQSRKRLFWTNIPGVRPPADRRIMLCDILERYEDVDEKYYVSQETLQGVIQWGNRQSSRIRSIWGKSCTLQAGGGGTGAKTGLYLVQRPRGKNEGVIRSAFGKSTTLTGKWQDNHMLFDLVKEGEVRVRRLTPIECERLQCLPDRYTEGVSDTQRYKMLGNAFNVDVVAHILSFLPR